MKNVLFLFQLVLINTISVLVCGLPPSEIVVNSNVPVQSVVFNNSSSVENNESDSEDDSSPVTYSGTQLWRVSFDNEVNRDAVADLQNNIGKREILFFILRLTLS